MYRTTITYMLEEENFVVGGKSYFVHAEIDIDYDWHRANRGLDIEKKVSDIVFYMITDEDGNDYWPQDALHTRFISKDDVETIEGMITAYITTSNEITDWIVAKHDWAAW
jgi:hypothetical protein